MQLPDKERLAAEMESAAKSINYRGPEWAAIERWLEAKHWDLALGLAAPVSDAQTAHNRGRISMITELLLMRDQYAHLQSTVHEE